MNSQNKSLLKNIFDVMFIMLLCFATLLSTMIIQGGMLVGGNGGCIDYSFNIVTFSLTAGLLVLYMAYVLINSDKEIKSMIKRNFGE